MPELLSRYYEAPRIQIVLSPGDNDTVSTWLVLHFPDREEPSAVPLQEGQKAEDAIQKLLDVYGAIRERFALTEPTSS